MADKFILNEDFDIPGADEAADVLGYDPDAEPTLEDQGWEYVASKDVYDEDGFRDSYMWYRKDGNNRFFFSSDVDYGDPEYFDWETEGDEAAQEWFDSYGEDEDDLTLVDNREAAILGKGDDPGFDEYDRVDEAVEDNLTAKAEIDTPRGTFYAYKGTWKDFENEPDRDDWGFWFDHYTDDNKHFKIMHNHIDNSAIAVLKEGLNESKGGFVEKYRGYSIHDAGDRYVITDEKGLNVGETRFGIPVCRGMIDDMIDGKEADKITEAKRTKFPRGFNLGSSNNQNVKVRNPYNYTIQELSINNKAKTFERGNFSMGRADIELKNRQEYEDIVDLLKDQGYTEVKSDYHSLRNKTRKGIREGLKESADNLSQISRNEARRKFNSGEHIYIANPGSRITYEFVKDDENPDFRTLIKNYFTNDDGSLQTLQFFSGESINEDKVDKQGSDNLKFIGNAKVVDISDLPRIGDSLNGGTVVSVNRKPNQEGYRIYEVGVAEDPDHEFTTSDDSDGGLDGVNTAHWTFAVKPFLKESLDNAEKTTKEDILEYAKLHGDRSAADLLLLGGYEFFDGTTDEYDALLKELEGKSEGLKESLEDVDTTDVFSKEEIETLKRNPKHSIIKGTYAAVYYEDEKKEDGTVVEASFILGVKNDDDWDIVEFKNGEDMNEYIRGLEKDSAINEDTVKQGSSWVNKGKEGTHGKFKTKKEADAQRKAMFAQGFKESLTEDPNQPTDTTVAGRLITAINDEWKTIDLYNSIISELSTTDGDDYKKMIPVIEDIVNEENVHVGQLQKALELISPDTADIAKGEKEAEGQISGGDPSDDKKALVDESCKKPIKESLDDDDIDIDTESERWEDIYEYGDDTDEYDDFELAGIYGGDLTYCPICGRRLQYDEDGDSFCPKCEKSAWELSQERRKLDKERKNESVEENPDDDIEGTEWYSTDIKEIPYGKNKKRIKNRKLVDIDKEPVRNPVNEGLEDSKENAAIIRTALASGSLDRDAFIDYVLTNTPDEMLSGAVNFIGTSNFDTEDDLDFLGDGVDVTDSFANDLFIDEGTLEDGSVITLKDYSKGDTTALQDGDNSTITTVQNDSEPACNDCDDLPDGVDITLVDVDDDKPLEEEKPLQEMGPLAATLLTAVAPVVADKVMDKVLPEEKEDENKVDDEVYGNADDDDVDIKGI